MRSLLILLIATTASAFDQPTFYFNDCVRVKNGFYKGCVGRLDSVENDLTPVTYRISLFCHDKNVDVVLSVNNIERTNEKGCSE